jgi:hypothetical protein
MPDFKVDALNPDLREVEQQYVLRTTDTTAAAIVGRNQVSAVSLVTVDVVVRVPAGWFLKLTTSNATLGLTTFY